MVKVTHTSKQVRISGDPAQVAFELPDTDRIELQGLGSKPQVILGLVIAHQVSPGGRRLLPPTNGREQGRNDLVTGELRRPELFRTLPGERCLGLSFR